MQLKHHGATDGVTGSCHQIILADGRSVLVDCGLFQGAETAADGSASEQLAIRFALEGIAALIVTHVHIDHVGRIPHLLAAGFRGPIVCSEASAALLPLVLEDAMKVGVTRDTRLINGFLGVIRERLVALPYGHWHTVFDGATRLRIKLQPAGHILGSAYVECDVHETGQTTRVVFSGDLGAPYTPLLPAPKSPYRADVVVLESTYGDRRHENRKLRREQLKQIITTALANRGTLLIPAFSIGRTQELLYELEQIIHQHRHEAVVPGLTWDGLDIIIDSPLAADFTQGYSALREHWDKEARQRLAGGRHPLAFDQVLTIADHDQHLQTVQYLARTARPAVVIAASGMCSGGRIVNYLKALLGDARHDVLFAGYQAVGTPGRAIQQYGPRGGYVELDGERYPIRARIHTVGGYSAHADQADLIHFIQRMRGKPRQIILVHGEHRTKTRFAEVLRQQFAGIDIVIP